MRVIIRIHKQWLRKQWNQVTKTMESIRLMPLNTTDTARRHFHRIRLHPVLTSRRARPTRSRTWRSDICALVLSKILCVSKWGARQARSLLDISRDPYGWMFWGVKWGSSSSVSCVRNSRKNHHRNFFSKFCIVLVWMDHTHIYAFPMDPSIGDSPMERSITSPSR